jgi:class 3 adenylate cyclase
MNCPACGCKNPDGAKYCNQCAGPLPLHCLKCGTSNPSESRFCNGCAAPLTAGSTLSIRTNESEIKVNPDQFDSSCASDGERKTVTALFADIKSSTELMEELDPEEARAIIDPALKLMIESVRRYDGYIVQSTGDGIFALFGAPVAHEDHPQLALYAALRMQEELHRYSATVVADGGMPIEGRIGVNTGEVVVRSITTGAGQTEYTPIGHTTNLASRMQAVAPTGSIAISEDTRSLIEGYFQLKPQGPTRLKGVSEPINVYEVVGLGPLRTRLQRVVGRGLTKFVGREHEIGTLKRALEQSRAGHGQVVAVMADPGVGKSRLFYEFKNLSHSGCIVLEAYSVSHGKLLGLDRSLEDTLPFFYSLLGIAEPGDSLAQMDPNIKRRRTLEAIKRVLLRESLNQPLILIFEDLHWIDGETQAFLNLLIDAIASTRILLLVNYRPEYRHDWGGRTYYAQLRLDPLGYESAAEMLSALLGYEPELEPLKQLIAKKTEGNPFFVEEMVQALFERGMITRNRKLTPKQSFDKVKIPPTVQVLLASRIDRLPADQKALLQTLAVIGREFTLPLIRRLASSSEAELERILNDLQRGEFIYEQPAFPDAEYAFKHALTQEVAYGSILIDRRKLLHERVGDAIESLNAGRLEECCVALAHHYSRSANSWKAVRYLHLAGQQEMRRSAHSQEISQFQVSLKLLRTLPVSPEYVEQEIVLQIDLGIALGQAKGYSSPEAGQAFVRARELCQQITETPRLVQVLWGLWYFYFARADHQAARDVAEQCMAVARKLQQQALLVQASFILGGSQLLVGDLTTSRESLDCSIRSYDRQLHNGLRLELLQYGQDPEVSALCPMALVYWHLGYPD